MFRSKDICTPKCTANLNTSLTSYAHTHTPLSLCGWVHLSALHEMDSHVKNCGLHLDRNPLFSTTCNRTRWKRPDIEMTSSSNYANMRYPSEWTIHGIDLNFSQINHRAQVRTGGFQNLIHPEFIKSFESHFLRSSFLSCVRFSFVHVCFPIRDVSLSQFHWSK